MTQNIKCTVITVTQASSFPSPGILFYVQVT